MFLARLDRNESVKIRIDGKNKSGKNTTRQIKLYDCNVDEVYGILIPFLREKTIESAKGNAHEK